MPPPWSFFPLREAPLLRLRVPPRACPWRCSGPYARTGDRENCSDAGRGTAAVPASPRTTLSPARGLVLGSFAGSTRPLAALGVCRSPAPSSDRKPRLAWHCSPRHQGLASIAPQHPTSWATCPPALRPALRARITARRSLGRRCPLLLLESAASTLNGSLQRPRAGTTIPLCRLILCLRALSLSSTCRQARHCPAQKVISRCSRVYAVPEIVPGRLLSRPGFSYLRCCYLHLRLCPPLVVLCFAPFVALVSVAVSDVHTLPNPWSVGAPLSAPYESASRRICWTLAISRGACVLPGLHSSSMPPPKR